ncbi:MAG: DUF3604 domain-containing protein [Pseudomonadales bacterium]
MSKTMQVTVGIVAAAFLISACSDKREPVVGDVTTPAAPAAEPVAKAVVNDDKSALFGELHIHTGWSFDAFIFKVRTEPDDAYRFAKGDPVKHPLGKTYRLTRPLDFMAVTDHAEYMGALPNMADPSHPYSKLPIAERVLAEDFKVATTAFKEIGESLRLGIPKPELMDADIQASTWEKAVAAANRHNEPGKFTALIGYEWTSAPDGANLHRNVIFADDNAPLPFSRLDSGEPEKLWSWMDTQRAAGHRVLAIPHNGNISNGRMFEREDSYGKPLTAAYAEQRMRNEPVVEVTQVKGTSETHPSLSPNDEFADFELVEQLVGQSAPVTKFKGGYVRDAFRTGLELQDAQGFNPYRFGMLGATDSHTAIVPAEENNYSGKVGAGDGSPHVRLEVTPTTMDLRKFSASGLAGVWAEENTRDGVFSALQRKETWATSGPRIQLRFFGGWDMNGIDPENVDWVKSAYKKGTSMGGSLSAADTPENISAPTFIVSSLKDADSANLDRIQIIKGWSVKGESHEKIYDVALSDSRKVDPTTGKAPPIGDTVNLETLEYATDKGASQLSVVWTDPNFDAEQNAFYYARVLEIPTPRWSSFDAKELGIPVPKDLHKTIQERAYSSPIWYDK